MAGAKYLNPFAGLLILTTFMLTGTAGVNAAEQINETQQLVKDVYPILTNGMLAGARLSVLPTGMLLRAGSIKIIDKDLQAEVAKAPEELRSQLAKNIFLILENRAARELLAAEATAWAKDKKQKLPADTSELLKPYFDFLTAGVDIDDKELKNFYDKNADMMGGTTLEQVKSDLKQYLLRLKRQDTIDAHIASIGKRRPVEVSKTWLEKQYTFAIDNPVDKARLSGKPSFVDFGADGCRPCDMMAPILESMKTEYAGKLNVLFVHVRKEQILAARYGIESIPVQVFFDKDGKEVFRHTGFFSREQIISKLAEIGVK